MEFHASMSFLSDHFPKCRGCVPVVANCILVVCIANIFASCPALPLYYRYLCSTFLAYRHILLIQILHVER